MLSPCVRAHIPPVLLLLTILSMSPLATAAWSAERVQGGLRMEIYRDIPGADVGQLLLHPKYPALPDQVSYVTRFTSRDSEIESVDGQGYGGRLSGWIVPRLAAQYQFFLRSEGGGQLSLSPDESPTNALPLASEHSCCGPFEETGASETSAPVFLEAGKSYYIEALWKTSDGEGYCDVAWRRVGDTQAARFLPLISGTVLATDTLPETFTAPEIQLTTPEPDSFVLLGTPITLDASAFAAGEKEISKVEFFGDGLKVGQIASPPYLLTLPSVTADTHVYFARAIDTAGIRSDSMPSTVTVGIRVSIDRLDGIIQVSWSPAVGKLESAPDLAGPWTTIDDAIPPYLVPAIPPGQLYRVHP